MADLHSELLEIVPEARHCILAELSAMLHDLGSFDGDGGYVLVHAPREGVLKKCFTLLEKAFNMRFGVSAGGKLFDREGPGAKAVSALCLDRAGEDRARLLLKNDCCRHSYLRGVFLCSGSLMDPSKGYRLEFTVRDREEAGVLSFALKEFEGSPGLVDRRGRLIVYLKSGSAIADLLTAMGAYTTLMELENARILREMRGTVNRRVNIETANIEKTVRSSAKQIEDIKYIESSAGLGVLPGSLYAAAVLRLGHPEESLSELGKLMEKPVSKSAMNHRMQRISEIAERLRKEGGKSAVKRSNGEA